MRAIRFKNIGSRRASISDFSSASWCSASTISSTCALTSHDTEESSSLASACIQFRETSDRFEVKFCALTSLTMELVPDHNVRLDPRMRTVELSESFWSKASASLASNASARSKSKSSSSSSSSSSASSAASTVSSRSRATKSQLTSADFAISPLTDKGYRKDQFARGDDVIVFFDKGPVAGTITACTMRSGTFTVDLDIDTAQFNRPVIVSHKVLVPHDVFFKHAGAASTVDNDEAP